MSYKIDGLLYTLLSTGRPTGGTNEKSMLDFIVDTINSYGHTATTDTTGNVLCSVLAPDNVVSRTLFTAHVDTVHSADCNLLLMALENENKDIILFANTEQNKPSVLGADDAAGIFILLNMIQNNVIGNYAFFIGEERGRIGSQAYLREVTEDKIKQYYDKVISFDRRGTGDIINTQRGNTCCSKEFTEALKTALNNQGMKYSTASGSYTDSATFMEHVSECTNISVGYESEHTTNECLNVSFLLKLRDAVIKIDWESLPAVRVAEPIKVHYNTTHYKYNNDFIYLGNKESKKVKKAILNIANSILDLEQTLDSLDETENKDLCDQLEEILGVLYEDYTILTDYIEIQNDPIYSTQASFSNLNDDIPF